MTPYDIVTYSIGGALLLLMILGIVFTPLMPAIDKWNKRYLIILFSCQLICVSLSFTDAMLYEKANFAIAERIIYICSFVSFQPLMFMPTLFLIHQSKESLKKSLLLKTILGASLLYFSLIIASQFNDAFYSVTDDNLFKRGPLFPLLISPLILMALMNFIDALIKRKKIKKRYFIATMVYLPPLMATMIVHMFISFDFFILLGVGLWALSLLTLIMQDNLQEHMRQQEEIANQQASILVLQMRPHFIYNTMTSIYYLCDQDPKKAKQVTLDFTTYLRKNFAAISSERSVPFTEELEHTRAYLAVEQAQFEDALFVEFNTPHTLFHLPPLTLQPIVENAVKHGMSESKDPIHIYVSTEKKDYASIIIVEDDGPGLKEASTDEPHIALDNIRQRLEMTCKGKLEIFPRKDRGTLVKITIPNIKNNDEIVF